MPAQPPSFPRFALLGAAALLGFAMLATAGARLSGVGVATLGVSAPTEIRELRFEDRADGSIAVLGTDGRLVELLPAGSNGFLRGVLRALVRERKLNEVVVDPPFRLSLGADDRLSIEDPATGRRIDLGAFGPTNKEAFARLLAAQGRI